MACVTIFWVVVFPLSVTVCKLKSVVKATVPELFGSAIVLSAVAFGNSNIVTNPVLVAAVPMDLNLFGLSVAITIENSLPLTTFVSVNLVAPWSKVDFTFTLPELTNTNSVDSAVVITMPWLVVFPASVTACKVEAVESAQTAVPTVSDAVRTCPTVGLFIVPAEPVFT